MRFLKRSVMFRLLIYSDILYLILRCWENGVLHIKCNNLGNHG